MGNSFLLVPQPWEKSFSAIKTFPCPPRGSNRGNCPSKYFWEDDQPWETPPLVSGYLPGWPHHSHFFHIFYLVYISIISLAESKSMRTKISEIKYIKNTTPYRTSNPVDPAKSRAKRTRIEQDMLDFCPGMKRTSQLIARIDGIDRDFLFGKARPPQLGCRVQALPLTFGGHTGKWGLSPCGY